MHNNECLWVHNATVLRCANKRTQTCTCQQTFSNNVAAITSATEHHFICIYLILLAHSLCITFRQVLWTSISFPLLGVTLPVWLERQVTWPWYICQAVIWFSTITSSLNNGCITHAHDSNNSESYCAMTFWLLHHPECCNNLLMHSLVEILI